jgi:HK97 family phage prohead protease
VPYFITDSAEGCAGWATIKDDGEVIGCHESKQAAIDQMVAVSIAEGMEPGGERNLDGPPAIIVDIDGTLLTFEGRPIENVVRFVDEYEGEVIIVTARVEDDRAMTIAELEAADVDWDQLFMKPNADADSVMFKSETLKDLLDIYNIEIAIEDDEDVRAEYARIGITVLTPDAVDPAELPEMLGRSVRVLPENYRPASSDDVPDGRRCSNCRFYDPSRQEGSRRWCERWDDYVSPSYYCNAWRAAAAYADRQTGASTPAPPEDQIEGSDENAPGSASGAGGDIELSAATETALRNKARDHNEAMTADDRPAWTRTTFGQLAAVYRRGAGAYSTSHRPGVSRGAWAMARVNAFLYLLRTGRPQNAAYVTDNDLLPEDHPRSTRSLTRQVDLTLPAYIRDAAARGLELRAEGFGGDGLVERTIREARLIAAGEVSEDKVVRVAAWAARHMVDLDAPQNSDPDAEGWPGAGAVAFYLWGIDPLDPEPAIAWFERKRDQIREEEEAENERMYPGLSVRERPGATLFHMENGIEQRRVTVNEFEVRSDQDGPGTFVGLASPFNSPSEPLPFIERVAPGAFSRSLRSRNEIKLFVNHDTGRVLASKRAGTLRLWESDRGLEVEAALPPTTDGKDMAILLKRGDIDSMSIGFSVPKGGDSWSDDGQERELREVRLHEVSLITSFPAYGATSAAIRSLDGLVDATGLEAEKLNAALSALEAGETLNDELAGVLDAAVTKLRASRDDAAASLALKQKQLDVLLARV